MQDVHSTHFLTGQECTAHRWHGFFGAKSQKRPDLTLQLLYVAENDRWLLQDASLDHLKLLHAVDCFPGEGGLYEGAGAANAIER